MLRNQNNNRSYFVNGRAGSIPAFEIDPMQARYSTIFAYIRYRYTVNFRL